MGEVWLAEQSEPVRRQVALKIIKLGMDTRQFLARLGVERQALAFMAHPLIAESLNAMAALMEDLGRTEEAEGSYRQALTSLQAAYGESSVHASSVLGNLGLNLSLQGRVEEAETLLRRALAMDEGPLGPEHPNVGVDKLNLGLLLCENGNAPDGVEMSADAVRIFGDFLNPEQWEMGAARSTYGDCLGKDGWFTEGEAELLEALRIVQSALGSDHPRNDQIRRRLAEIYQDWGRPEEAAMYRNAEEEETGH
jgi:tetratricopeptide (TPR) repeat protein